MCTHKHVRKVTETWLQDHMQQDHMHACGRARLNIAAAVPWCEPSLPTCA